LQPYKPFEHVAHPVTLLPAAMTSRQPYRSTTDIAAAAKRRKRNLHTEHEEQQPLPDA